MKLAIIPHGVNCINGDLEEVSHFFGRHHGVQTAASFVASASAMRHSLIRCRINLGVVVALCRLTHAAAIFLLNDWACSAGNPAQPNAMLLSLMCFSPFCLLGNIISKKNLPRVFQLEHFGNRIQLVRIETPSF